MIPVAGSAYTYGYATLGELVAWIIGWDLILEYLFAASTVAVGWSGYFTAFMAKAGFDLPPALTGAPFSVVGTHTLVRSEVCMDPATGGVAVDAVSRTLITGRRLRRQGLLARQRPAQRAGGGTGAAVDGAAGNRHQGVGPLQQHWWSSSSWPSCCW